MNDANVLRPLRLTLFGLVVLLTFEGLLRKLQIPGTSVFIFFLKDLAILALGIQILMAKRPAAIDFLSVAYVVVCVLFIPLILMTAFHDPILAVFGAKEYLLYPIVGIGVFVAFESATFDEIILFFRCLALLLVPTTYTAILQLSLPPTHWLNLSVAGDDLEGFSAGGHLRVSSTFSFVAQFCAYLNAETFMLILALSRLTKLKFPWSWLILLLIPLLVVSCYITGSRGAVVGNMVIIMLACLLSLMKFEVRSMLRIVTIMGSAFLIILVAQHFFPNWFAAYSEREGGKMVGVSGEIQQRVYNSLFDWITDIFSTPLFGNGLGIMSNGSDQISDYAAGFRETGAWTETDFATTLFEGGFYLIMVWYGFRYYVVYQTTRRFLVNVNGEFATPGAFCQAVVVLFGLTATLGIQPPLAIWWWLAVGTSSVFWWKCVEPQKSDDDLPPPPAPTQNKIRGRSAYAERLHGRR